MSKLISNPLECGHRGSIFHPTHLPISARCKHKDGPSVCNVAKEFPTNCPLQDGQPIPKTTEELIEMTQKELKQRVRSIIVAKEKELGIKPKRRNHKDCKYYHLPLSFLDDIKGHKCRCAGKSNLFCIGVNCGSFKTR